MGSRMLKRWLHMPIWDIATLTHRQETIRTLQEEVAVQPLLRQVGDLKRVLARLALRSARPHDLARMSRAFAQLPAIQALLAKKPRPHLSQMLNRIGEFEAQRDLLIRAVVDAPPVLVRDGGVIVPGYHAELDEWHAPANGENDYLDRLELR